ncbi:MAG: hypothetical protein K2N16_06250 [Muribaculaceae bacterium]|nr:hypothetical protein [Muribaculaceae bacterium]
MKKFFAVIAVVMMSLLAFNTAQADAREDLLAGAKEINDTCPMGDDVVLKSVKVDGDNLVFTYVMPVSKADLDMFKTVEKDVMDGLVADMRNDEVFKQLFDLCKAAKCNLVIRFSNAQGQYVDMTLPNSKL